ncbi:2-polyprenylphenol hydroxylase [Arthrobacter sp. KK5.5]|uniref:2-polyprenylphenol hydroxylase n=1 Tax=Arthrobacter sp. KK5.5 TaxID=3373084 RepID=UPI003EE63CBC
MDSEPEDSEPDRFFVHGGRRWRRADPSLPDAVRRELLSHLGRARADVKKQKQADHRAALAAARRRVQAAKEGLGERGEPWWEQSPEDRRRRWNAALEALAAPPSSAPPS